MPEKTRIHVWDNLKFILIILVVIGHFADCCIQEDSFKSTYLFIYAFHMPLFIFISGLLHKNENIANKVYMYLCLGFLLKVNHFIVLSALDKNTEFHLLSEGGTPWFLFALAFFVLLSYVLRNVDPKYVLVLSIIAACFVGYDDSISDFLVLSRVFVFYPFYVMGNLMQKTVGTDINVSKLWKIPALLILLFWAWLCFTKLDMVYVARGFLTGRNPFPLRETYPNGNLLSIQAFSIPDFLQNFFSSGCFYRFLCYILSFFTGGAVILLTPHIKLPVITEFGKRTLQVYFWHYSFIYIMQNALDIKLWCSTPNGRLIYCLMAVLLTFTLSLKLFSYPLSPVMKIKKQQMSEDT